MAQLMPLPLTVSCFSKIQTGVAFLVPAHRGSPGQRAVKRVCVCVCLIVIVVVVVVGLCLANIRPATATESGHGVLLFCCSDYENEGSNSYFVCFFYR